jgi:tRNA dimethylallyltransferase
VGKTEVAVALARRLGTRIISCDSMQLYAGFPVLTNQPRGADGKHGLHELVGCIDPARSVSAGEYAAMAKPLVDEEVGSRGMALVVGGSGLYMRAALAPLAAVARADPERRELLEARARSEGPDPLYEELAALDPEAARAIDPRNVRRVVRALEVLLTGEGLWSGRGDLWAPEYYHPTLIVGLVTDGVQLAARIRSRTESMLKKGAVKEVRHFREARDEQSTRAGGPGICSAIGYGAILSLLQGELDLAGAVEEIERATRRYARRQLTWLRKVGDAVMIDVRELDPEEVAGKILGLAGSLGAKGSL